MLSIIGYFSIMSYDFFSFSVDYRFIGSIYFYKFYKVLLTNNLLIRSITPDREKLSVSSFLIIRLKSVVFSVEKLK